jgi:hypothetical protein
VAQGCDAPKSGCETLAEKVLVCMSNACVDRICDFCAKCINQRDEKQCTDALGIGDVDNFDCDETAAEAALKSFTCQPYSYKISAELCPSGPQQQN